MKLTTPWSRDYDPIVARCFFRGARFWAEDFFSTAGIVPMFFAGDALRVPGRTASWINRHDGRSRRSLGYALKIFRPSGSFFSNFK